MTKSAARITEKQLYEPIKEYLRSAFCKKFGDCHLEVTSNGIFSEIIRRVVRDDIVFSFLGKKASPDLVGFIPINPWMAFSSSDIQDFITVEIKKDKLTLQDVYQAKMYGDLFRAKYALLISPKPITEELKRLDRQLFITFRYKTGYRVYIGEWFAEENTMAEFKWYATSPYKD
jgi:hypothetical protein